MDSPKLVKTHVDGCYCEPFSINVVIAILDSSFGA